MTAERLPAGHYRFRDVARMEWIKLRSLRSTWWTLAITVAGAIGIAVLIGASTRNAADDLTSDSLVGILFGVLFVGVLGILVMTSEYTSGQIRSTLTAAPGRWRLLAAKAAVFGAMALAVGEVAAFLAFFAGGVALGHGITAPTLGQPGVLHAVTLTGASIGLIGLLGLGLGAIIRHTPAALGVLVGAVYVGEIFVGRLSHAVAAYLPIFIVSNSLSSTRPTCPPAPLHCNHLSAWAGLGALALYAGAALVIGGWLLARRDA
jgi:ABC-2 type transport system permease protein